MRTSAVLGKCVLLSLCLLLVNCAEDIPDPLSMDDFSDITSSQTDGSGTTGDTSNIFDELPDDGDIIVVGDGYEITITVGAGARPQIQVSEPLTILTVTHEDTGDDWMLQCIDAEVPCMAGPFQYGVVPAGASQISPIDGSAPPDLVTGQVYEIMAVGEIQGFMLRMGILEFTR